MCFVSVAATRSCHLYLVHWYRWCFNRILCQVDIWTHYKAIIGEHIKPRCSRNPTSLPLWGGESFRDRTPLSAAPRDPAPTSRVNTNPPAAQSSAAEAGSWRDTRRGTWRRAARRRRGAPAPAAIGSPASAAVSSSLSSSSPSCPSRCTSSSRRPSRAASVRCRPGAVAAAVPPAGRPVRAANPQRAPPSLDPTLTLAGRTVRGGAHGLWR